MDFALYAMDQTINQAAKWRSMFGGGDNSVNITIRMIINRGGEQVQHSQALHSIFSHIPAYSCYAQHASRRSRYASCVSID